MISPIMCRVRTPEDIDSNKQIVTSISGLSYDFIMKPKGRFARLLVRRGARVSSSSFFYTVFTSEFQTPSNKFLIWQLHTLVTL